MARMVHFLSFAGATCLGVAWGWATVLLGGPARRRGWFWPSIILATVALLAGFTGLGLLPGRFAGSAAFAVGAAAGVLAHLGWLSSIRSARRGVGPGG